MGSLLVNLERALAEGERQSKNCEACLSRRSSMLKWYGIAQSSDLSGECCTAPNEITTSSGRSRLSDVRASMSRISASRLSGLRYADPLLAVRPAPRAERSSCAFSVYRLALHALERRQAVGTGIGVVAEIADEGRVASGSHRTDERRLRRRWRVIMETPDPTPRDHHAANSLNGWFRAGRAASPLLDPHGSAVSCARVRTLFAAITECRP